MKQSEAENGLFLISIHLLTISLFIFAFYFQGHPLPFGGSVIFFFCETLLEFFALQFLLFNILLFLALSHHTYLSLFGFMNTY